MVRRTLVITLNTYREAVRARVLHGLFALAIATGAYALIVGQFALRESLRVVSDLGSASISAYAIIVAIVICATSLYRELELKTIFPILARPIRRGEYLVGKYFGALMTLSVFVLANAGALLLALGKLAGGGTLPIVGLALGSTLLIALIGWKVAGARTYLPVPWAVILFVGGYLLSAGAPDDRRVIVGSALLTIFEVGIVAAIATVFASFSSPFLTAIFTFSVFVVGRSADTLARLPEKVFGPTIKAIGAALSKVMPNLMLYVPPRPLLTGEQLGAELGSYLLLALGQAMAWAVGLLAVASLIFRRRDFL